MAKTDYADLDNAILAALRARPMHHHELDAQRAVAAATHEISGGSLPASISMLGRRLQALRKSGMVRHENRTGWHFIPLNG